MNDDLLHAAALAQSPHPGELEYMFAEKILAVVEPMILVQILGKVEALLGASPSSYWDDAIDTVLAILRGEGDEQQV